MIIAKKGKNINPNIVINDTVTTFIGITKLSGFAIILNANIVNPDKTIFVFKRDEIFEKAFAELNDSLKRQAHDEPAEACHE